MINTLVFSECDHEGDLETYAWEVTNSGVEIVGKRWDDRKRIAVLEVIVNDEREWTAFLNRFKHKASSFILRSSQ